MFDGGMRREESGDRSLGTPFNRSGHNESGHIRTNKQLVNLPSEPLIPAFFVDC